MEDLTAWHDRTIGGKLIVSVSGDFEAMTAASASVSARRASGARTSVAGPPSGASAARTAATS